jgi:hypothetical protein
LVPKNASYFFGISVHDYELKKGGASKIFHPKLQKTYSILVGLSLFAILRVFAGANELQ